MAAKQRNLVIVIPFKYRHGGFTPGGAEVDIKTWLAEYIDGFAGGGAITCEADDITMDRIDEVKLTATDAVNFAQDRIGGKITHER